MKYRKIKTAVNRVSHGLTAEEENMESDFILTTTTVADLKGAKELLNRVYGVVSHTGCRVDKSYFNDCQLKIAVELNGHLLASDKTYSLNNIPSAYNNCRLYARVIPITYNAFTHDKNNAIDVTTTLNFNNPQGVHNAKFALIYVSSKKAGDVSG